MSFDVIKQRSRENAEYIEKEIAYCAENMSPRLAGSVAEQETAEYTAGALSKTGAKVMLEPFKVAPGAAMGWVSVTVVCMVLALAAYFFVSMVSVALIVLAMVPFVVQGLLCSRAFDGAYKTALSHNVTAVLPCSGEVRRRVFFTAHLDAAPEMSLSAKFGGKAFVAVIVCSLVGAVYFLAANIARWAYLGSVGTGLARDEWMIIGVVGLVFVPFWIACLFMTDEKKIVPGANDNLSGCFTAVALMKALHEAGVELKHTEVGVVLTGSEECGLRGAKAWCDEHAKEYGDAIFITLDVLREADAVRVGSRDLNGLVKLDREAAEIFSSAARGTGLDFKKGGAGFGATDAAAFAAAGLKATSVTAMSFMPDYYHTRKDSADNIDVALIEKFFLAAVAVVEDSEKEFVD